MSKYTQVQVGLGQTRMLTDDQGMWRLNDLVRLAEIPDEKAEALLRRFTLEADRVDVRRGRNGGRWVSKEEALDLLWRFGYRLAAAEFREAAKMLSNKRGQA